MKTRNQFFKSIFFVLFIAYMALIMGILLSNDKQIDNNVIRLKYAVLDSLNADSFIEQQFISNTTVQEPEFLPKKTNKFFEGWYYDKSCSDKVVFLITLTQNITLYPNFILGNIPDENIKYDDRETTYYISGQIDIGVQTLVIPDVYDDGIHGAKSITYIDSLTDTKIAMLNASTITKCIIGNYIQNIPSYFAYNNSKLCEVVLGKSVESIDGTAFGNCNNLTQINLGDLSEWSTGDDDSTPYGWYEELNLNYSSLITALNVNWVKTAEKYVVEFKIGFISDLSKEWSEDECVDYNSNINYYYNSSYWSDIDLKKEVSKRKSEITGVDVTTFVDIPLVHNSYFVGWYEKDSSGVYTQFNNQLSSVNKRNTLYARYYKGNVSQGQFVYDETIGAYNIDNSYSGDGYTFIDNMYAAIIPDYYYKDGQAGKVVNINQQIVDNNNPGSLNTILIGHSVQKISNSVFHWIPSLTKVEIPESIREIGAKAFDKCSFSEIKIGKNIKSIGERAFYKCNSLKEIKFAEGVDGCEIGNYAFSECTKLESVNLPEGIERIGNYAFSECSSLKKIETPSSIAGDFMNDSYAFTNCTSLTKVIMKKNICYIGTFKGCESLEEVEIVDLADCEISDYCFSGCTNLKNINLDGIKYIQRSAFTNCKSLTVVNLNSIAYLAPGVFNGCSSLEEIKIGSITSIDSEMFKDYSFLKRMTIPDSVLTIGDSAFYNCIGIEELTMSNNITSIGKFAFYKCESITNITLPDTLTKILDSAFEGCISLVHVNFGNGIKSIYKKAFYNCKSLTEIYFPASLIGIGIYAFQYSGLIKAYFDVAEGWKAVNTTLTLDDPVVNAKYLTVTYVNKNISRS